MRHASAGHKTVDYAVCVEMLGENRRHLHLGQLLFQQGVPRLQTEARSRRYL